MANSPNTKTLSVSLSGDEVAHTMRYIEASRMNPSRFIKKALMLYIATRHDLDDGPTIRHPVDAHVSPHDQRRLIAHAARRGLSVRDFIGQTLSAYMDVVERKHGLMFTPDDKLKPRPKKD